MGQGQKFWQRWEFRRRDSQFDALSSQPESCSSSKQVTRKRKIVSSLIPPKIEEAEDGDISRFRKKGRSTVGTGINFRVEKSNKTEIGSSGKDDDPVCGEMRDDLPHKDGLKNSKSSAHFPSTMDDIRLFTESILEELKVARENMFKCMKEEILKMMSDDSTPGVAVRDNSNKRETVELQHHERFETGSDVVNSIGGSLVESVNRKSTTHSHPGNEVLGNQAAHCQTILSTTSMETEREVFCSSVKRPSFSVSPLDEVGSSMYLTLPTVLPNARVENQRSGSSSDYFQTREVKNKMGPIIGKAKPTLTSSIHSGSFPGELKEEKFGNITCVGSQDLAYIGQNKLSLASSFGSGFPVPFHHGLDGTSMFRTQVCVQNQSQVQGNVLGLSMTGGIRSVGEGRGLPELYVANNLPNHENSKVNDNTWTQGNLIPASQRGLFMQELLYQD